MHDPSDARRSIRRPKSGSGQVWLEAQVKPGRTESLQSGRAGTAKWRRKALCRLFARFDEDLVYGDVIWLRQGVDDGPGHVLGVEYLAPGRLAVLFERLLVAAQLQKIRRHVAGLDGRHLEAGARGLQAQALREGLDKELARGVHGEAGEGHAPRVGGDGDDVPSAPIEHAGEHRADAVQRALAVDLDGPLPLLGADVLHQREVHDPSAVDERVHRAELGLRALHQRSHLAPVRHVGGVDHAPLAGFELWLYLPQRVLAPGGEDHPRALFGEHLRDGGPDAARGPRHHYDAIPQGLAHETAGRPEKPTPAGRW